MLQVDLKLKVTNDKDVLVAPKLVLSVSNTQDTRLASLVVAYNF